MIENRLKVLILGGYGKFGGQLAEAVDRNGDIKTRLKEIAPDIVVEIQAPLIGMIVRYAGYLEPQ